MRFFIGTDVGGTFTDLWVADQSGKSQVLKFPTTADVMGGVIAAVRLAAEAYDLSFEEFCAGIEKFGHGTTVGLNALLTGRAAKTGIVTTLGFGDTLEIGRIRRQTSGLSEAEVTDFFQHNRFAPLVARDLIVEVRERIDANGNVLVPLDEDGASRAIAELKAKSVEAVAICTLWSTVNPVHELRLKELTGAELSAAFVSMSHEISPVVGEYGRMSTTAANASLGPITGRYLSRLESMLRAAGMKVPILMMTNAGGVLPTEVLNDRPAYSLFSGPAAGVIGSLVISEKLNTSNVLTIDIGGTSFDVGVIVDGKPIRRSEISVAGADIRVPSIDVASIGAGGGSIASVKFGDLTVGPQSAGANPGPACYGRGGTEATATDADLILGVLDPKNFIGGQMQLDADAARRVIAEKVAKPLGISVEEAAWSIREVLDNKMADLLRRVTIERGFDPTEFTLLANGGAGPSHAWVLARELGLKGFVVPAAATGQSAYGCANSDLGQTDERPVYLRVKPGAKPADGQLAPVDWAVQAGRKAIREGLDAAGARGNIEIEQSAAVKYRGQTNTVDIPLPADRFDAHAYQLTIEGFERQYESLFGRGASYSQAGFEVVAVRTIGHGKLNPAATAMQGDPLTVVGARDVVFDDPKKPVRSCIYRIRFPRPNEEVVGPCIVEYPGQSVVVPPGSAARSDVSGNLHVRLGAVQ
jgi:N-methylhydantoinase A